MDEQLMYMTGNGKIAGVFNYGRLVQAFGPPYSSPSVFASDFSVEFDKIKPEKEQLAPIWRTKLQYNGRQFGAVCDFTPPDISVLVRGVEALEPFDIRLFPYKSGLIEYIIETAENTYLVKTKNGNAIYNDYPLNFPQFFTILAKGEVTSTLNEHTVTFSVTGKATLYIIGGPDYPEAVSNYEKVLGESYESLLASTREYWQNIFNGIPVYCKLKNADVYRKNDLLKAIEDAVTAILVQQGDEGGVLAGYNYHLGYVRDQFGVAQCLLRLGMYEHAKKILSFYVSVFRQFGKILNAQAMGVPGIFHFAENDNVEITGYLLLQFFSYAAASGDKEYLLENIEFLEWLYDMQQQQLYDDTLPFNGDETYIAGGLLPRDVIADGSAEATLLFLYSGQKLCLLLEQLGRDTGKMRKQLEGVKNNFAKNFIIEGKYYINQPYRKAPLPRFRYGVCMNSNSLHFNFGWTQLTDTERYLCPECYKQHDTLTRSREMYSLPSALLIPAYLGISVKEIDDNAKKHAMRLAGLVNETGNAYSKEAEKINVGYDYGLLLINLLSYKLPYQQQVYSKILDLRDEVGVWSEYYVEGRPFNTRYRPWESAINLDALLQYALKKE